MIATVSKLIEDLNNAKVDYCHWKSNDRLDEVFAGETDIDLLVGRGSSTILFNEVISHLGFKQAYQQSWEKTESVEHYYAYDQESGLIVHLHVYFRVISGGALLKNYHLPVEKMLLENCDQIKGMQVRTERGRLRIRTMVATWAGGLPAMRETSSVDRPASVISRR